VVAAEEQGCWLFLGGYCLSTVVMLESLKRSVWREAAVSHET